MQDFLANLLMYYNQIAMAVRGGIELYNIHPWLAASVLVVLALVVFGSLFLWLVRGRVASSGRVARICGASSRRPSSGRRGATRPPWAWPTLLLRWACRRRPRPPPKLYTRLRGRTFEGSRE